MSHIADTTRSDMELAGLLLQCGLESRDTRLGGAGLTVSIVTVTPFPPRVKPTVVIAADGQEWRFEASVSPPGAELLLPQGAALLASGPWQSARELSIKVSFQERSFDGIIPVDGIGAALARLAANCPTN
jgi:hypothetical protein